MGLTLCALHAERECGSEELRGRFSIFLEGNARAQGARTQRITIRRGLVDGYPSEAVLQPEVEGAAEELAPVVGVDRPVGNERVGCAGAGGRGALDGHGCFVPVARGYRAEIFTPDAWQPLQARAAQFFGEEAVDFFGVFGVGRTDDG